MDRETYTDIQTDGYTDIHTDSHTDGTYEQTDRWVEFRMKGMTQDTNSWSKINSSCRCIAALLTTTQHHNVNSM